MFIASIISSFFSFANKMFDLYLFCPSSVVQPFEIPINVFSPSGGCFSVISMKLFPPASTVSDFNVFHSDIFLELKYLKSISM